MSETLRFILILGGILAGALSIFFSNQLMRKYKLPYLNSYFYYILFLYIFGVYSLIGSGAAKYFFDLYEVHDRFSMSIELFLLILGTPFLILFNYMLIRISFEISNGILSGRFTLLYFIISLLMMAVYTFFSIRVSRNHPDQYGTFIFLQKVAFSIFLFTTHLFSFIFILLNLKSRLDRNERQAIRFYSSWFLFFPIISLALLYLSEIALFLEYIFIFFFLAIHLLPILFHTLYLEKYYVSITAGAGTEDDISRFIKKYEISKRETDIVELICRGQSNQEISDSLFISLQTVKDHVHRIYNKTGVKNRVQLINLIRSAN